MSSQLLAIGEVARLSGKPASAIRYYEKIGLIEPPPRESGRRRYPSGLLRTLAVIETAQRAGLTLEEIRLLLQASVHDRRAIDHLREVAERRLPALCEAIARAELVRGWLTLAAACQCPRLDDCPLFDQPSPLPERGLALKP
jgi:MerR family transcriptional regulator, redox-sensitive transcriptional activator SoxR